MYVCTIKHDFIIIQIGGKIIWNVNVQLLIIWQHDEDNVGDKDNDGTFVSIEVNKLAV